MPEDIDKRLMNTLSSFARGYPEIRGIGEGIGSENEKIYYFIVHKYNFDLDDPIVELDKDLYERGFECELSQMPDSLENICNNEFIDRIIWEAD